MSIIQRTDYTWKTIPYVIAWLNIPIVELAKKLGMTAICCDDEDLGMSTAFLCELSDGLIVGFEEFDHVIETKAEHETYIHVESYELRKQPVEKLLYQCLNEFGLTLNDVSGKKEQKDIDEFLGHNNPSTYLKES